MKRTKKQIDQFALVDIDKMNVPQLTLDEIVQNDEFFDYQSFTTLDTMESQATIDTLIKYN